MAFLDGFMQDMSNRLAECSVPPEVVEAVHELNRLKKDALHDPRIGYGLQLRYVERTVYEDFNAEQVRDLHTFVQALGIDVRWVDYIDNDNHTLECHGVYSPLYPDVILVSKQQAPHGHAIILAHELGHSLLNIGNTQLADYPEELVATEFAFRFLSLFEQTVLNVATVATELSLLHMVRYLRMPYTMMMALGTKQEIAHRMDLIAPALAAWHEGRAIEPLPFTQRPHASVRKRLSYLHGENITNLFEAPKGTYPLEPTGVVNA